MGQKSIISIKNIEKTYNLGEIKVKALRKISLDIQEGEFLIITGRNGSGKSTLLRQIGLLDWPNRGQIYLDGDEVTHLKEKHRREIRHKKIGYIFQEYALIPELNAIENVMLPAMLIEPTKVCRPRAIDLLKKVGLENRLKHQPKQMSGGEQQKVAIARALINNPKILFADEPTANLDSIAAGGILEIFERLHTEGHTIVMISHEQDEKSYASRIIELRDGVLL
ncbi:MAG: ABC transporter ATP-binding protein [Patescibacteria group bacterium]|jgi:putative ABC transport system ATP-binding protein